LPGWIYARKISFYNNKITDMSWAFALENN
jgi:hypothetical protein